MYEELLEAWRREREGGEIQPLSKDFYRRLSLYFRRMMEYSRVVDAESISAHLLHSEIENASICFRKLYELRIKKMVSKILEGGEVARLNITNEEAMLVDCLEAFRDKYADIAESIVEGRELRSTASNSRGMVLVRFLRESPAIVGVDLKTHGPFKPEDVAYIPKENAEILEKRGIASRIKPEMLKSCSS